ncbi:MAG: YHS domain-containing protein [Ignavibacteriales bacterium]|nr:MAG: YHS domain-containing protein [Ignavibacteriales bacterium]
MNKILLIIIVLTLSINLDAQEKNKSTQTEKEKHSTSIDSSKVTDNKQKEIWNELCPVQGNKVEKDVPTVEHDGKVYGFCCPGCDTKFAKNPEKYVNNLSKDGKRFLKK